MSDAALPPALSRIRTLDPQAADELASAFTRLTRAGTALSWAQARLPRLLAAPTVAARLEVLVDESRQLTGAPGAWAVTWRGKLGGNLSFRAVAGDGSQVPAPEEISRTIVGQVIEDGRPSWSDDALVDARFTGAESVQAFGLRSIGCLPLGEQGVLYLHDPKEPARFPLDCRAQLTALAGLTALLLDVDTPSSDHVPRDLQVDGLVGAAPSMLELYEAIHVFAAMPWPALVLGETGTGKEAVARALHTLGADSDGPFVPVNCGAIPDELAESTLFGHVKGAFTGADRPRDGMVSRAAGGTLFLDEVGELSARVQVKLLRLLQEGTYNRVGEDRERTARCRIVAATHRQLDDERDAFRDDLYYRLAACILHTPPLRERRTDIPALARHLLAKSLAELPGGRTLELSDPAVSLLTAQEFPGNVRELENSLRGAIARAFGRRSDLLLPEHFRTGGKAADDGIAEEMDLAAATDQFQQRRVHAALAACNGNRSEAAKRLGVSRQWLYRLLARWEEE